MTPEQESTLSKLEAGTHVLVPVEPTNEMVEAAMGCIADGADPYDTCADIITAAQEVK